MHHTFEIQFIMDTHAARIMDLRNNTHLDVDTYETVTEENFKQVFTELVQALFETGKLGKGNVLCTTFPAGAIRIENYATYNA
jgi:hypothetical protein